MQGLLVCGKCNYSYYAKPTRNNKEKTRNAKNYVYYRCLGGDPCRFHGKRVCNNKPVNANPIELMVWEEVKSLLKDPRCLEVEYKRRLSKFTNNNFKAEQIALEKRKDKLRRSISRLVDSYTEGYIDKKEFEPRIKSMKANLLALENKNIGYNEKVLEESLENVMQNLKIFSEKMQSGLEKAD